MTRRNRALSEPPASFEDLKQAIACRQVTFPDRLENVAKRLIAEPELVAFLSSPMLARDCGVSTSTIIRFIAYIGFRDFAQARKIFRDELRRRSIKRLEGISSTKTTCLTKNRHGANLPSCSQHPRWDG